jgi:PAS domain S-box-containing protein
MKDEDKTREQLISEIEALRKRIVQLELRMPPRPSVSTLARNLAGSEEDEEASYWKVFENVPVGVYRTTPDDRIVMANLALARMLGYDSVEELLAVPVSELYVDIEDRFNHLQKLLNSATYFTEFELRRKDGEVIWVRDFPRAILGPEGKIAYFDGVLVDISEPKKIEKILLSRVIIGSTAREDAG